MILAAVFFLIYMMVANVPLAEHSEHSEHSGGGSELSQLHSGNPTITGEPPAEIKLCPGSNGTEQYQKLKDTFTGCSHVDGNLNINNFTDKSFDFLKNIQEVRGHVVLRDVVIKDDLILPRLQVIRGEELYSTLYSLFIASSTMKTFQLPALLELGAGRVFVKNSSICHWDAIKFENLMNDPKGDFEFHPPETLPTCPTCHENCTAGCWAEGKLNCVIPKIKCRRCPERCYQRIFHHGLDYRDCCHSECAGGCTGPEDSDCLACKNVLIAGSCKKDCQYNPHYQTWAVSIAEDAKNYTYGNKCVKKCPSGTAIENDFTEGEKYGTCRFNCPGKKDPVKGICPLVGPRPVQNKTDTYVPIDLDLIFAKGPTIKLMSLISKPKYSTTHTIINLYLPREAGHLEVDCLHHVAFWAMNGGDQVYTIKWGTPELPAASGKLYLRAGSRLGGLAYDWIRKELYYSLSRFKYITKYSHDSILHLYDTALVPGKIVVDPLAEYLFWVENDSSFEYIESRIVKAPLIGKDSPIEKKIYIVEGILDITSLTLDFDNKRIYWLEINDTKICSTDYHGNQKKQLVHFDRQANKYRLLLSIVYFQDWIYWTELNQVFKILKAHTNGTIQRIKSTKAGLLNPDGGYGGLQICHDLRQKKTEPDQTKSETKNDERNATLIENEEPDVIFAKGRTIKLWSLKNKKTTRTLVDPKRPQRAAEHLDVDCRNKTVFWAVSGGKSIYMSEWKNSEQVPPPQGTTLIDSKVIGGLAFNWFNDEIYWTDSELKTIIKINRKGHDFDTLYHTRLVPKEIVLDPKNQFVLWSENNNSHSTILSTLMRGPLRGEHKKPIIPNEPGKTYLVENIPHIKSLTIDLFYERIYWVEFDEPKINWMFYKVQGSNEVKIFKLFENPTNRLLLSITNFEEWLYWTELDRVFNIYKMHIFNGTIEKIRNTKLGWFDPGGGYGAIQICHHLKQKEGINTGRLNHGL